MPERINHAAVWIAALDLLHHFRRSVETASRCGLT